MTLKISRFFRLGFFVLVSGLTMAEGALAKTESQLIARREFRDWREMGRLRTCLIYKVSDTNDSLDGRSVKHLDDGETIQSYTLAYGHVDKEDLVSINSLIKRASLVGTVEDGSDQKAEEMRLSKNNLDASARLKGYKSFARYGEVSYFAIPERSQQRPVRFFGARHSGGVGKHRVPINVLKMDSKWSEPLARTIDRYCEYAPSLAAKAEKR